MNQRTIRSSVLGKAFLMLSALVLCTGMAFAGSRKISKDLQGKDPSSMVDVIVQFDQVPTAKYHQKIMDRGGALKRQLGQFKGSAYRMPASELEDLAKDPAVKYISMDRPLRGSGTTGTSWVLDYHNETINTSSASTQGLNGNGIGVAVIDSGIASVSDLSTANIVYSEDFTGLGSPLDQYGHGTHVSGIIAGNGSNSSGPTNSYTFKGIAPGVNLVNLRVLDQNGAGTDSEVIAAILTAIQLQGTYNIRVINLSLGRPVLESYTNDPLCQAVEQAWKAGIAVVVAAGNYGRDNDAGTYGYGTITAPGNDPYVITVGAMNTMGTPDRTDDVPASYSSKGPSLVDQVVKPDLVAPGNLIISLYTPPDTLNVENPSHEIPTSLYQTNGTAAASPAYFILSGTSMATPMVSATAALMLQQNAALTPDQIKARLMLSSFKDLVQAATVTDPTTGQTFNEQADIFTVGAGYLDIQAALASTELAPPTVGSALSPTANISASGSVVLVNGSSILGSGSSTWSVPSVWGNAIFSGTDSLTGDAILWGTSSLTGDAILWGTGTLTGDAILWGTDALTGEAILWGTGSSVNDFNQLWGRPKTQVDANSVLWGTKR